MIPRVLLRDEASGDWLAFRAPRHVVEAHRLADVVPSLLAVEQAARGEGLHAAGFIAYEAAPAFDPALIVRADHTFPLLWFGLFDAPARVDPPRRAAYGPRRIDWRSSLTAEAYRRGFAAIRRHIRDGNAYQVNFTQRLCACTATDPWELFTSLVVPAGAPYAAWVDAGDWAIGSASPELFWRLEDTFIESRPMKGTAGRGLWPAADDAQAAALLASAKDHAENVMIADMVRNDLGRVAETGSVRVPSLFALERYPHVWQATTTVRARTTASLADIMRACFPAASITGAPKARAMQIIAGVENAPRRVYTGTIGYWAPGRRAQFNVAIRSLLVHRPSGAVEFGVGGGIVWDSRLEAEQRECLDKARLLHEPLPAFDLFETMLWDPSHGFVNRALHLARLKESARYFGFPLEEAAVCAELDRCAAGLPHGPHRIRLLCSSGSGPRASATRLGTADRRFPETIALAGEPVDRHNLFLYHKTTRRDTYARARSTRPGAADVLMFNREGEITETTIANVAVELDGRLVTPPIACGLLGGTQRAALLAQGTLHEQVIRLADIARIQAVFLMNAVRGLQKVRLCKE